MPADTLYRRRCGKSSATEFIRVPGATQRPCALFLPSEYQPKYTYPLILLLHDSGYSDWHSLANVPLLSSRNYLVLCPRGSQELNPDRYGHARWAWASRPEQELPYLQRLITAFLRRYSHPGYFYVISLGQPATVADHLVAHSPLPVTGLALLDPPLRSFHCNDFGSSARPGLHLFLSTPWVPDVTRTAIRQFIQRCRQAQTIVHLAKSSVPMQHGSQVLRQVNHWIMDTLQKRRHPH
jgi:hypothetical protein